MATPLFGRSRLLDAFVFVSLGDGVSTADSVRHGNGENCQCSFHTDCATASAVVTTMCNCHCSRHTASVLTTPFTSTP